MNSETYVMLFLGLVFLVTLLALLIVLMKVMQSSSNQSQMQTLLLTNLLGTEQNRVQSLLNQVRAQDPMTLHGLQAATGAESPSEQSSRASYLPEEVQYMSDLADAGLKYNEVSEELHAAGWDGLITADYGGSGGNPVIFDRPES